MDPDNAVPVFDALHVPPAALDQGGVEVLRAVIVDGALHVSLRRAFDDPDAWGMLIADVTRHVARIYATESNLTQDQVIDRVRTIYDAEMDSPTDPGTTSAIS
ncbi:MAG: DUF5076 domain-containing protein [Xanthobacteraceae bacterium]|nr:DUF5076 domain-containing protein [Xanthobacteraceae bacterium]